MKKVKDLAVKTGSYQKDGKTKNRYLNVGVVMQGDDGNEFMLLEKTFNPAGVASDKNTILISMFDVDRNNSAPATAPSGVDEDIIPF